MDDFFGHTLQNIVIYYRQCAGSTAVQKPILLLKILLTTSKSIQKGVTDWDDVVLSVFPDMMPLGPSEPCKNKRDSKKCDVSRYFLSELYLRHCVLT